MIDMPIRHIILMVYTWTSVLVYCILLFVIIKNRRIFNGPFYTMVICEAVCDFLEMLTAEFLYRPRRWSYFDLNWAQAPDIFRSFPLFADLAFRSSMTMGYPIFALNRFTVFVFPLKHKYWSSNIVIIAFVVIWICSLIIASPMFYLSNSYVTLPDGTVIFGKTSVSTYRGYAIGGLNIVCVSFCLIIYSITIVYSMRAQKNMHTISMFGVERSLLLCSVVTFLPGLFEFIRCFVGFYRDAINDTGELSLVVTDLWYFSSEVASTIQCWTLLFVNPTLRGKMYEVVSFSPKSKTANATISSNKASERALQSKA